MISKLDRLTRTANRAFEGGYATDYKGETFEPHARTLKNEHNTAENKFAFSNFLDALRAYEDAPAFVVSIVRMHTKNNLERLTETLKDQELIRAIGQFAESEVMAIWISNMILNGSITRSGIANVVIKASREDETGEAQEALRKMIDLMNSEEYRNIVAGLVKEKSPNMGESARLMVKMAVSGDRTVSEDIDEMFSRVGYSHEFVQAFLFSMKNNLFGSEALRKDDVHDPERALEDSRLRIDGINMEMLKLLKNGLLVNDPRMIKLLVERTKIARVVGNAKRELGMPIVDKEREAKSEEGFLKIADEMGIDRDYAQSVIRLAIISARLTQWEEKVAL